MDADTLAKSPGWMPDSALPGAEGMSVILGHRNRKLLKRIENVRAGVKVGDENPFRFASDHRLVSYVVTDVQIFEKTADGTPLASDENILVPATRYPFRYTGSAPGKVSGSRPDKQPDILTRISRIPKPSVQTRFSV
ncbi:MAG: sortase [Clostridia bacterium]|nr:sortase [Clostridia bacterium]